MELSNMKQMCSVQKDLAVWKYYYLTSMLPASKLPGSQLTSINQYRNNSNRTTQKGSCFSSTSHQNGTNVSFTVSPNLYWIEVQAFVLNFNGRVDKASVKNFQLIDEYDDNHIYMQFGRIGQQNFNMDVAYPCSIFQAFAIGLTSFDFKFACEWVQGKALQTKKRKVV